MVDGSHFVVINPRDIAEINELLAKVGGQAPTALHRALKNTVRSTKTLIAKELGSKVTLKAAYIKSKIHNNFYFNKGKFGGVIIVGDGKNTYLTRFTVNPATPRKTKKGVTVKVWRSRAPVRFKKAFWAQMKSGHKGIFQRVDKARLPINELAAGPSLASVYTNTPGLAQLVESNAAEKFSQEVAAQVNYLLLPD